MKAVGEKQLASHGATSLLKGECWRGFVSQGDLEEQQVLWRKKEGFRISSLDLRRFGGKAVAGIRAQPPASPERGRQSSWISCCCCCCCLRWGKEMNRVVPRCLPASPVPAKPELREHQETPATSNSAVWLPMWWQISGVRMPKVQEVDGKTQPPVPLCQQRPRTSAAPVPPPERLRLRATRETGSFDQAKPSTAPTSSSLQAIMTPAGQSAAPEPWLSWGQTWNKVSSRILGTLFYHPCWQAPTARVNLPHYVTSADGAPHGQSTGLGSALPYLSHPFF
ncbi:uncharacterized protein LOC142063012 [Phalacrocorax aristotelis]|uniref:uncharacterized protein LOC142063012 n=1 Tax=Phalacrocorax aristotelis TaxID=126867 RepID=UPI003F4BE73F